LNERSGIIKNAGSNLSTNVGVFDTNSNQDWRSVTRAAGLSDAQAKALEKASNVPRFVTSEDIKQLSKGIAPSTELAASTQQAPALAMSMYDYQNMVSDFDTVLENATQGALENSLLESPDRVERRIRNIAEIIFDRQLNDTENFIREPVQSLRRVERDLEDRIANLQNQGSDLAIETANGLADFLYDVRGIRSNVERRVAMAEQGRPRQQAEAPAQPAQPPNILSFVDSVRQQNPAIADRVETILFRVNENTGPNADYPAAIRLAAEQEAQRGAAEGITPMANNVAGALREFAGQVERAQNPVAAPTIEGFTTEVRRLDEGVGDRVAGVLYAINEAININTRPAEYARAVLQAADQQGTTGTVQDVSVASFLNQFASQLETATRQAFNAPARNEVAIQGEPMPAMGADELLLEHGDRMTQAQRNWLQNFIQRWDTFVDDTPGGAVYRDELERTFDEWSNRERLQPEAAAENLGDWEVDEAHPANQPAPQAPRLQVQDPVPREMQTLNRQDLVLRLGPLGVDEARRIAQLYFNDNIFNENTPVSTATDIIRNYNFGPHEGQPPMVRELAARELEELFTTAQQDADILANTLDEAMYQDMDSPEEAMRAAERDIRLLRQHGEGAWEDVFGPLAEDYPWSRNTQELAIRHMQEIADGYRRQLDEQGPPFARGGLVNRARTPMVVPRRSPELAEMAYRYGGMV
jgi:hypothetical protein